MIGDEKGARVEPIPIARVRPRKLPVRSDARPEEIALLAASVRKHGLLHPILVRPAGREFEVVCGQRRLQACRSLGMGEVPAVVRSLDDRQAFELSVAENARRSAMTPEDRRNAARRLSEFFPGRKAEELEGWLGPAEADAEPLPMWLEQLPETETKKDDLRVVMTGDGAGLPSPSEASEPPLMVDRDTQVLPTIFRKSLVFRVKTLLSTLSKTGRLVSPLLQDILHELYRRYETTPLPDFLDLSYRSRTKRYVSRHCLNVAKLSLFLAKALGMPKEEVEQVTVCGLLHDVGMMKVKHDVFTKHAALDAGEWEQVKGHPIEGSLLLTKEVVLRDVVARVAQEHHERPDGSGYPHGKKKEDTHVYARLINVVDTYGAMVSPRAHRLPYLPHHAMKIVMDDGAKGMLDWDIVHAFVKAMSVYPVGSYLKLEGGEIARVVRASPDIPEKPVIAVIADASRNLLRNPVEIDLAMTEPLPNFEAIPAPM